MDESERQFWRARGLDDDLRTSKIMSGDYDDCTERLLRKIASIETAALTSREIEILTFYSRGFNSRQICELLGIKPFTLQYYRKNIRKKLHAKNIAHSVAITIGRGYITAPETEWS